MNEPTQEQIDTWRKARDGVEQCVAAGCDPLALLFLSPEEVIAMKNDKLRKHLERLPEEVKVWLAVSIQQRVERAVAVALGQPIKP